MATTEYDDLPTRRLLYATEEMAAGVLITGVVRITLNPLNCTMAGAALEDQARWLPLPDRSYQELPTPGYDWLMDASTKKTSPPMTAVNEARVWFLSGSKVLGAHTWHDSVDP